MNPSTQSELSFDLNSIPDTYTLNSQQVADMLFTTKDQVEIYARKQEIPCFKLGRSWVFPLKPLLDWMNKRARDNIAAENDDQSGQKRRRGRRRAKR